MLSRMQLSNLRQFNRRRFALGILPQKFCAGGWRKEAATDSTGCENRSGQNLLRTLLDQRLGASP